MVGENARVELRFSDGRWREGDVLVAIDGREVRFHEELMRHLLVEARPGEPVEVDVIRDGDPTTLTLTPGERPTVERRGGRGGRDGRVPVE